MGHFVHFGIFSILDFVFGFSPLFTNVTPVRIITGGRGALLVFTCAFECIVGARDSDGPHSNDVRLEYPASNDPFVDAMK